MLNYTKLYLFWSSDFGLGSITFYVCQDRCVFAGKGLSSSCRFESNISRKEAVLPGRNWRGDRPRKLVTRIGVLQRRFHLFDLKT